MMGQPGTESTIRHKNDIPISHVQGLYCSWFTLALSCFNHLQSLPLTLPFIDHFKKYNDCSEPSFPEAVSHFVFIMLMGQSFPHGVVS